MIKIMKQDANLAIFSKFVDYTCINLSFAQAGPWISVIREKESK